MGEVQGWAVIYAPGRAPKTSRFYGIPSGLPPVSSSCSILSFASGRALGAGIAVPSCPGLLCASALRSEQGNTRGSWRVWSRRQQQGRINPCGWPRTSLEIPSLAAAAAAGIQMKESLVKVLINSSLMASDCWGRAGWGQWGWGRAGWGHWRWGRAGWGHWRWGRAGSALAKAG